jgi:hypothetical protein
VSLTANLRTTQQLFLDSSWIQIRTELTYYYYWAPLIYAFSPVFSLSLSSIILDASLSLSFSRPLQKALSCFLSIFLSHYNFFGNTTYGHHGRLFKLTHGKTPIQANKSPKSQHNNTKKNLIHISVMIQKTQKNPTQHHHTQITDQDLLGIGDEDILDAWLQQDL